MEVIDLGKRIVEVSKFAGDELVIAGRIDLVRVLEQAVIIISGHIDINVVVPGYKALVAHRAKERSARKIVADPVFLTDIHEVLKDLQFSLLNLGKIQLFHCICLHNSQSLQNNSYKKEYNPYQNRCPHINIFPNSCLTFNFRSTKIIEYVQKEFSCLLLLHVRE